MQYYTLIAGFPDIALDDIKSTVTIGQFRSELDDSLSSSDRKLIESLFLKYDNMYLLSYLNNSPISPDGYKGILTPEDFPDIISEIKETDKTTNKKVPDYMVEFTQWYFETEENINPVVKEDHLTGLYYNYMTHSSNSFIREWSEFNLNMNNIITSLICKKIHSDHAALIVGNNYLAETLRQSNMPDAEISDIFENYEDLRKITEEKNLLEKEKNLDMLRWNWIDKKNTFNYFSIEKIIEFILKLQIQERWLKMNDTKGQEIFNSIINDLKGNPDYKQL